MTVRAESLDAFIDYLEADALYLGSAPQPSVKAKTKTSSKAASNEKVSNSGNMANVPEKWYPFQFEELKTHGKGLIAKLPGCETKEQAALFAGRNLAVQRELLPELEQGEHYWSDLIGLEVHSTEGDCFGLVDGLMETGANDVLIVQPSEQSCDEKERLIPYLPDQVVIEVDSKAKRILVEWDKEF